MLRVDINLLFTVINILLLAVAFKIFLFKPVENIIAKRQEEVEEQYDAAVKKQEEAEPEGGAELEDEAEAEPGGEAEDELEDEPEAENETEDVLEDEAGSEETAYTLESSDRGKVLKW